MTDSHNGEAFRNDMLAGRVALVTGGGTGIGAGVVEGLARHGCDIAIASRRLSHLEPMAERLTGMGRAALAIELDVRNRGACDGAVERTIAHFGRIDLLVNNAAGNFLTQAAELSERGWRAVVEIVLNGTFNMSQAVYPAMREAAAGSIINITTTYTASGAPLMAHSGAAKAGVLNLTRTLAVEWGGDGIRVNAVAPGLVEDTEGARRLADSIGFTRVYAEQVPLGRLARVEDIAGAVLFLVSPAAAHVTGIELIVDGGASLGGHFKQAAKLLAEGGSR